MQEEHEISRAQAMPTHRRSLMKPVRSGYQSCRFLPRSNPLEPRKMPSVFQPLHRLRSRPTGQQIYEVRCRLEYPLRGYLPARWARREGRLASARPLEMSRRDKAQRHDLPVAFNRNSRAESVNRSVCPSSSKPISRSTPFPSTKTWTVGKTLTPNLSTKKGASATEVRRNNVCRCFGASS